MDKRGHESERLVEEALIELKNEEFIEGYKHARVNGELDTAGIDFLIFLKGGAAIPLQVKGNYKQVSKHKTKYPHISAVFVVGNRRSVQNIKKRLKTLISKTIRDTLIFF